MGKTMEYYQSLVHAMQSGVATMMHRELNGETSPKHLRVGVNSAMCDQTALVRLLIAKGVITQSEYEDEVVAEMEREVKRYESRISSDGRVKLV